MTITLDLSAGYLTEPGHYEAVLDEAVLESFKPSRKHPAVRRISWTFRVTGGEHESELINHTTELRQDLLWLLRKTLYAVGLDSYKADLWDLDFDDESDRLVHPMVDGVAVAIDLRTTKDGFTRTRVRRMRPNT